MDAVKTGKLIREVRGEKKITQKELAEMLHVSNAAISKWENGHGFPDISLLEPLADALEISVTELVNGQRNANGKSENSEAIVKEIIQLSECERKRRNRKQNVVCGLLVYLIALLGYDGITYLWSRQGEPIQNAIINSGVIQLTDIGLGLAAWILAVINIARGRKMKDGKSEHLMVASFACCAIAVWLPILCTDLSARKGDFSSIEDTIWGYNFAAMVLLLVTFILNIVAYYRNKNREGAEN